VATESGDGVGSGGLEFAAPDWRLGEADGSDAGGQADLDIGHRVADQDGLVGGPVKEVETEPPSTNGTNPAMIADSTKLKISDRTVGHAFTTPTGKLRVAGCAGGQHRLVGGAGPLEKP
jgi:hypothetical protein